ncbi:hypothetical protein AB0H12_32665 [Actinosynnema sp. NPDC023794]
MRNSTGRRRAERDPGNAVFGSIGWLFADLMLALALAFIVAVTAAPPQPPGAQAEPTTTTTTPPTTTTTTPSRPTGPALELEPVKLEMPIDAAALLGGDAGTAQALRDRVRADPRLAGRRAGLVMTFGGTGGSSQGANVTRGLAIADRVNGVLGELGAQGFVFDSTVYRSFISLGSPDALSMDVYLFKV